MPVLLSGLGVFGRILCTFFFICLSFAGFTSLISNVELVTHTINDMGVSRVLATSITGLMLAAVGTLSALSRDFLTNQVHTYYHF